jgi:hypothetical protein
VTTLFLSLLAFGAINPLAWPLNVLLIAAGGVLLPLALLVPATASTLRAVLLAAAVGLIAGGLFYAKGGLDCSARAAVVALEDKVRLLELKAAIDAKVRAADSALAKLQAEGLRDFDTHSQKVLDHVESTRAAASCGLSADTARRVRDIFKAGAAPR